MSAVYSIPQLDDLQCQSLINEIGYLDLNIDKKVQYVMTKTNVSIQEALEYVVTENVVLWAKVYLNWECRDYQFPILEEGKKSLSLVLRLGRRLGKTSCICILILWHAYTQRNKDPLKNIYEILIVTPYETQIDLIFKDLAELVSNSPLMSSLVEKSVHHKYIFGNNTHILGLTAGANNGSAGGNNSRGQAADKECKIA